MEIVYSILVIVSSVGVLCFMGKSGFGWGK